MKIREKVAAAAAALLIIAVGMGSAARADIVTIDADNSYQDVGFIEGSGHLSHLSQSLDIVLAGTYQATLKDFSFPEPFQTIQLVVTSATHEYGRLTSSGSFLFDADPGRYFVSLIGQAGAAFDLGLYGIEIAYVSGIAPVPLPPAALLLLSALGVLAMRARGRRQAQGGDAVPLAA